MSKEKDIIIEAEEVHKHFKMGTETIKAVDGVSFKIHQGDFVFIIGPSGSGKTTLLDMIGALSHPTKGHIIVDGKQLNRFNDFQLSMFRRNRLGFIFQTFNLIPTMSATDNVLVPLVPEGYGDVEIKRAQSLLSDIGLEDRLHNKPNQLSGGERQRVAICRAFINLPKIIVADEPTGNLDTKKGNEVFDYLRKLNKEEGLTFIIVTHDTEYIKKGDKVLMMRDGKLEKNGHKPKRKHNY